MEAITGWDANYLMMQYEEEEDIINTYKIEICIIYTDNFVTKLHMSTYLCYWEY